MTTKKHHFFYVSKEQLMNFKGFKERKKSSKRQGVARQE
jgi:hypothetical protein